MFWNKISGIYDFVENAFNGKVNKEITQYAASLNDGNDDVLECACGTGMFSLPIARRCRSLIATDFAVGMLAQAQKKCRHQPNVIFKKADITSLGYADESFNKIVAANVIHRRPTQSLRRALARMQERRRHNNPDLHKQKQQRSELGS